jgi:hypothetical protein
MKRLCLSRRALLRGAAGLGVGLPWLEAMHQRAQAQTAPPKRYIVMFGGHSLGADNDMVRNLFAPDVIGRGYDLKAALAPIADYPGLQDEISVISGLTIPWAALNGGTTPPGGRPGPTFHADTASPLLSGVRSASGSALCNGPTSDQIVADQIAGNTTFRTLTLRAQALLYVVVGPDLGIMSHKSGGAGAAPIPVPPEVSPAAVFNALFGNFTSGLTPAQAARQNFLLRSRQSILDLVRGDTERLMPRLGAADQVRLSRHLDEIRDLERRVSAMPPVQAGACQRPADPGPDPALGMEQANPNNTLCGRIIRSSDVNLGYSGEDTRARVMCDLIHMAIACDLTRVATLMLTMFRSSMNMYPLIGVARDLHDVSHETDTATLSRAVAWHIKHFAYLAAKLGSTPEGNGTLLDNCAMLYLCEGGQGRNETGSDYSTHSSENMACLLAGRAGGLKPGQHIVATGQHPAAVITSAMNAVGVAVPGLGEVTGTIPQLFM